MTTNTHAPAQQALLSKLRAPVADERARELREVLEAVQQQFSRHGNSLPDGFDARVLRWVDDALASAPVAGEAIQKAKHDTCHAETERERVTALAYWLDQQTFEPGMLSIAAATLRAMLSRDAAPQASEAVRDVNAAMAAEYQRWIDYYHQGRDYDDFLKECVHNRAALSAQPGAQKGGSDAE